MFLQADVSMFPILWCPLDSLIAYSQVVIGHWGKEGIAYVFVTVHKVQCLGESNDGEPHIRDSSRCIFVLVGLEGGLLGKYRDMAQPRKGNSPSEGMLLISQGNL